MSLPFIDGQEKFSHLIFFLLRGSKMDCKTLLIIIAVIAALVWMNSKSEKFVVGMSDAQLKQTALQYWNGWNAMPASNEKSVMKGNVALMKSDLDAVDKSETSGNVARLNASLGKVMAQSACLRSKPWMQCVTISGRESGGGVIG